MSMGWNDAAHKVKPNRRKIRDPRDVHRLSDCKQADVVLVGGEELRIAWFCRLGAAAYPVNDVGIAMDGSNIRHLDFKTPLAAIALVP